MNVEFKDFKSKPYAVSNGVIKYRVVLIDTTVGQSNESFRDKLSVQDIELVDVTNIVDGIPGRIQQYQPDVLILSVDFLDAVTLDQLVKVNERHPLPIVVFAMQHAPEVVKVVVDAEVSSYVVDNVQAHRIPVIIDLAMARFAKQQSLYAELKHSKEKLSERKLIERAKGIIMQQKHLSEEEAYSQMRRSAMNQGQTMVELAKRIISVFEMLG